MDLLQNLWRENYRIIKPSILVCAAVTLTACATSAPVASTETVVKPVEKETVQAEVKEPEVEPLPFNAELVYYILTAELAGQRGEIGVATELYNKAAMSADSPALASRSTEVASFTRDRARINRALERWQEVEPNNAQVYVMHAPYLIMQQDYAGVTASINKAISLSPDKKTLILSAAADSLSELAPAGPALNVLQETDVYKNQDPEALYIYARLAAHYKQYDLAMTDVDKVLALQNNREDALILKAEILQRQGKGQEALSILKKPANKKEASDDLLFAYAKILGENGYADQAGEIFQDLHEKLPENQEILFALGLLALEQKEAEKAKSYFTQLISMGDQGQQAAYFMGLSEELEKNTDAALVWYSSVPGSSSRFQAAQVRYVNLLADNGQLEKARMHLKLLRKENPKAAEQYYIFEGSFLRQHQQKQAALAIYNEALSLYPNNQELLFGRAMVFESLNKLDGFEQDLKKILSASPNNATVLNALGYTLTDRTDRHPEALALIQRAVAISPNDPFYLDSLGWVYYKLGDLEKASLFLKQAVALKPDAEFLAHLGEVLWQQGNKEEAKKVWQQGLEKSKDDQLLNDTMRRFGQ